MKIRILYLIVLSIITFCQSMVSYGQVEREFVPANPPHTQNIRGNAVLIGNRSIKPKEDPATKEPRLTLWRKDYKHQPHEAINEDNYTSSAVGHRGNNSSKSTLELPIVNGVPSRVVWAGLYWTGIVRHTNRFQRTSTPRNIMESRKFVKFRHQNDTYKEVRAYDNDPTVATPAKSTYTIEQKNSIFFTDKLETYMGYADVTEYVKQYGAGDYYVADLTADLYADDTQPTYDPFVNTPTHDSHPYFNQFFGAGWSLAVVYENEQMPSRYIKLYNGKATLQAPCTFEQWNVPGNDCATKKNDLEIDVFKDGFYTPESGAINPIIYGLAAGGDLNPPIGGKYFRDYIEFLSPKTNEWVKVYATQGNKKGNPISVYEEFFSGEVINGSKQYSAFDVVMAYPDNTDKLVFDNKQTTSKIRFVTEDDYLHPFMLGVSFENYHPIPHATIERTDTQTGNVTSASFKVKLYNKGDEALSKTAVYIPVPKGTTPASINTNGIGTARYVVGPTTIPADSNTNATPTKGYNTTAIDAPNGYIIWEIPTEIANDPYLAPITEKANLTFDLQGTSWGICTVTLTGRVEADGASSKLKTQGNIMALSANDEANGTIVNKKALPPTASFPCAQDNDGVADPDDEDDDNDGIKDTEEGFTQECNTGNVIPSSGGAQKGEKILFFNWTGNLTQGATASQVINGITYTLEVIKAQKTSGNDLIMSASPYNAGDGSASHPNKLVPYYQPSGSVGFYHPTSEAKKAGNYEYAFRVKATKNGVEVPYALDKMLFFDMGYSGGGETYTIKADTPIRYFEQFNGVYRDVNTQEVKILYGSPYAILYTNSKELTVVANKVSTNGKGFRRGFGIAVTINCVTDTDGDGIPDHLDNDSDNDGCPDAQEGDNNIKASEVDANGQITGGVDIKGIPTKANGGQTKGVSNVAGKHNFTTDLPTAVTLCKGESKEEQAVAVAFKANGFNNDGSPDWNNASKIETSYKWEQLKRGDTDWSALSGTEVTEEKTYDTATGETTLKLKFNNVPKSLDGAKYRLSIWSEAKKCPDESIITLKVNEVEVPTVSDIIVPTCAVATGSVELTDLPSGDWTIIYGTTEVTGNTTSHTITNLAAGVAYQFKVKNNATGCISAETSEVYFDPYQDTTPPVITPPSEITLDCRDKDFDTKLQTWLKTATATDNCGVPTITNTWDTVKPANICSKTEINVGFIATDTEGNISTGTSKVKIVNIVANNDSFTTKSSPTADTKIKDASGNEVSIFKGTDGTTNTDDDVINGNTPTVTSVTITPNATNDANFTIHSDGSITTKKGTPSGVYTLKYQICDKVTNICSNEASVTIELKAEIQAVNDNKTTDENFKVKLEDANKNTPSILGNDKLNGETPVANKVEIKPVAPATSVVVKDANGNVTDKITLNPNGDGSFIVDKSTPAGIYKAEYFICEKYDITDPKKPNTTNCSEKAVVTIEVESTILAKTDDFKNIPVTTTGGTLSKSVFEGDTLTGKVVDKTTVSVEITNDGSLTGVTIDADGKITIPKDTPVGEYTLEYQICEKDASGNKTTNCSKANVVVKVIDVVATIKAVDDDKSNTPINGKVGGNAGNILDNDTINTQNATTSNVKIKIDKVADAKATGAPVPTINTTTGQIDIPAGTPAGIYEITYHLTDAVGSNPSQPAKVTVKVTVPDTNRDLSIVKIAVPSVENPRVGQKVKYTFKVTNTGTEKLTNLVLSDPIIGVTLTIADLEPTKGHDFDVDYAITQEDIDRGRVVNTAYVSATRPDGTRFSEPSDNDTPSTDEDGDGNKLNDPTITLLKIIDANDDAVKVTLDSSIDGKVPNFNVFANDKLHGNTFTGNEVILTSIPVNGISINADGSVSIGQEVASGIYRLTYTICDKTLTTICDTAEVVIEVVNDCELVLYNALSVNGDGSNDVLQIKNIECYPDNIVRIFNRWGVEVFNTQKYDNASRVFEGFSTGRVTISKNLKLPQGTYYLILEYKLRNGESRRKGTWIYISPNDK